MGQSTKIDWCDATWNPVTGCLHGCEYCYARSIANRFGGFTHNEDKEPIGITCEIGNQDLDMPVYIMRKNGLHKAPYPWSFNPTMHRYLLDQPFKWSKPRTIFVCSMADLFGEWVPDEWIKAVFDACEKAPWHRYIFLTKNPSRLTLMAAAKEVEEGAKYSPETMEKIKGHTPLPKHDNWWFGSTLDNKDARRFQWWGYHSFISIEPLTEYMDVGLGSFGSDKWVIIGAETGNRKKRVIPKREWVDNIVEAASITQMKVFMKESLRDLMGSDFRQEFPWEVKRAEDNP